MGESRRNGTSSHPNEGVTLLMYACQQGHESEVRHILSKRATIVRDRDRTGKTALHYCAENANLNCVDQVLAVDPSLVDMADEDGYTALHLAVISGNKGLVRYLVNRGADLKAVDKEKHSVAHWATVCGELDCLAILVEVGADPSTPDIHGAYPIHYAAQMCGAKSELGNNVRTGLAVLKRLLTNGVNVNVTDQDGRQPLLWAASAGSSDAVLALVNAGANVLGRDKDGLTALHCAASRGHNECLETLYSLCGAELDAVDHNGCTALFYAVTLGHADCTEVLLKYGAEPNRQDRKGRTPAHCGAAKGQLETLKILAKHGGNLWMKNIRGDLPLHEAVQSGRKDLVRWLLEQRPDAVNASNNDGRTLLHIAAINNNVEMCKVLMDLHADINPIMRNSKGQLMTPLDAALHRGRGSCAKYLQLSGAVPAAKLGDRNRNSSEPNQFGGQTPDQDNLSDSISRLLERGDPHDGSPQDDKASQVDMFRQSLKDQGSQTLPGLTKRSLLHHGVNAAKVNYQTQLQRSNPRTKKPGMHSENVSPVSGDNFKDSGISDSHTMTHSERGDYSDLDSDSHSVRGGSDPNGFLLNGHRRRHRTARATGAHSLSNGAGVDSESDFDKGFRGKGSISAKDGHPVVQNSLRRYQRERRIFQVLLELNRQKIRGGRTNEQVLVKQLAETYGRDGLVVNQQQFQGPHTFRAFEKYLYDQLRLMSTSGNGLLVGQNTELDNVNEESSEDPMKCTHRTYQCHHAAHAYTGIPCAAFIKPKVQKEMTFLPHILPAGKAGHAFDVKDLNPKEPVTVEVKQGKEKKMFVLPTEKLNKNRRYQGNERFRHAALVDQVAAS